MFTYVIGFWEFLGKYFETGLCPTISSECVIQVVNQNDQKYAKNSLSIKNMLTKLQGLIERITYFNDENGYTVTKVKVIRSSGFCDSCWQYTWDESRRDSLNERRVEQPSKIWRAIQHLVLRIQSANFRYRDWAIFRVGFDDKKTIYEYSELDEIVRDYAVLGHKFQGSEYPAVVIPLLTQHCVMQQRNFLYTAVTREKKLMVIVGWDYTS